MSIFISGAGQALSGVVCMALSSKPRYAVFVFDIKMYDGSVSLLCIFHNCRLAITRGLRWMDEWRGIGEGWRGLDGDEWMNRGMDS